METLLIVQAPDLSQAIELAQALVILPPCGASGLVISVAADAPNRVMVEEME